MAARIIKSVPGSGTVSRRKIRAAVKVVMDRMAKSKASRKKLTVTNQTTASGRGLIAFRKPSATASGR